MRRTSNLMCCLATAISFAAVGTAIAQGGGGRSIGSAATKYGWFSSLDEARAEAGRLDKPLMLVLRCDP